MNVADDGGSASVGARSELRILSIYEVFSTTLVPRKNPCMKLKIEDYEVVTFCAETTDCCLSNLLPACCYS